MLANNAKINWLPEHIKDGRFGKFLETNVDWALSRERYWGTPLPIWKCQDTGKMEAVGSYDELMAKPGVRGSEVWDEAKKRNPELPDDLRIHKPYIDEIVYDSPFAKGARHAPRPRSHRLLVRRRLDAVRPMGLPPHARTATNISNPNSRPTSSAKPSTKPAAGSTASSRSAR